MYFIFFKFAEKFFRNEFGQGFKILFMSRFIISNRKDITLKSAGADFTTYLRSRGIRSVLLALSGGPDSMLCLRLLADISRRLAPGELSVHIAHANFNLRGEESLRDCNFIHQATAALQDSTTHGWMPVTLHIRDFDTEGYASSHGISIEMAARELRHGWFRELMQRHGIDRLVTGHNAGDNEETLLLNLLRGSSTKGLAAMNADNGIILRPLLSLPRPAILGLLAEAPALVRPDGGELPPFVTDSTNLESDYRRNFLRNEILPLLETKWEGTRSALQQTIRLMQEENAIVEESLVKALANTGDLLTWEKIEAFPSPVSLLYRFGQPYGLTSTQAFEIAGIGKESAAGQRWQLSDTHSIIATPRGLKLESSKEIPPFLQKITTDNLAEIAKNSCFSVKDLTGVIDSSAFLKSLPENMAALPLAEKVGEGPICPGNSGYEWRYPQKGDRIKIGAGRSKLVSDLLKDAKIPLALRSRIPILTHKESGTIVWLPGVRRAATHLVDTSSEYCLLLQLV